MKNITNEKTERGIFLPVFMIICFFSVGLFHNSAVYTAGVVLCIYLIASVVKKGGFRLYINLSSVAVAVLAASYLLSCLWAVDGGGAFLGFLRYCVLLVFALAVMQVKKCVRESIFLIFAYSAVGMTVVSAVLMQFDATDSLFSVAGRLSGFLQYPNTFAVLLLCAMLIILTKEKIMHFDYAMLAVLLFGILYSGSRIVFALTVVLVIAAVFTRPGKKVKVVLSISLLLAVVAAVAYGAVSGNIYNLARFLTIDLAESTFVGRILYWIDALPLLLRYPFGMGYLGYYYVHTSIQSGVYYLSYVHNDFLQLMLEVGIVPAGLFVAAIVKSFFRKGAGKRNRFLILALCAHSFFDFDMQFVFVLFILLMCLGLDGGKAININGANIALPCVSGALGILLLYFTVSQTAYYTGNPKLAYAMHKSDTQAALNLLVNEDDPEEMYRLAEEILSRNEYSYLANSAMGNCYFSQGDVPSAMEYKREAIRLAPFEYDEYEQYCEMLVYCYDAYKSMGDEASAEYIKNELASVVGLLEESEERLSPLGKKIKDQPKSSLSGEISLYVKEILGK